MLKYLLGFGSFFTLYQTVQAQNAPLYYKVHALEITEAHAQFSGAEVDFGYNFTAPAQQEFLHEGYYLWVQDQWYWIKNAAEVFQSDAVNPLLFRVVSSTEKLKIEDVLGVVYTYPIEAIEPYAISEKDYKKWQTQAVVLPNAAPKVAPAVPATTPEPKVSQAAEATVTPSDTPTELPHESPILDVLDIKETTIKTVIPFDVNASNETQVIRSAMPDEAPTAQIEIETETPKDPKVISSPKNAYEKAVAEGFDGTVTEWIDAVNALGGKTAYEQAVEAGFDGTEEEWKRSLWGTMIAPEIEQQEKTTSIVMKWMKELNSDEGYSPYEMALRNGFYGTFTEWVESVIGTDGEQAYQKEVEKGYTKSYKEWIEEKLTSSNEEILRKEMLRKNNFVVVPNVLLELPETSEETATFDLFQYYQEYYGNSMFSSTGKASKIELRRSDLEYQITWFNKKEIEIIELSKEGVLNYRNISDGAKSSRLNLRFVLKN